MKSSTNLYGAEENTSTFRGGEKTNSSQPETIHVCLKNHQSKALENTSGRKEIRESRGPNITAQILTTNICCATN